MSDLPKTYPPIPEQIRQEPATEIVDDMLKQTQQALQSSARAAVELNELRRRTEETLDWRTQLRRHPWVPMGLAIAVSILAFLAFRPRR